MAITLGIVLVFNPEKTRPFLFNTMGLFWLTSGVVLIRHTHPVFGRSEDGTLGKRMSILLGAIGILTGLLVLTRSLAVQAIPEVVLFELLGAVILLTGILHLIGEFRIGRMLKAKRTTGHKILAIFEIALGVMLIVSPLEPQSNRLLDCHNLGAGCGYRHHWRCPVCESSGTRGRARAASIDGLNVSSRSQTYLQESIAPWLMAWGLIAIAGPISTC